MKGFKTDGHMTVEGLFNQRSYDRWKGGPDWRGREGEPGRGEWAGAGRLWVGPVGWVTSFQIF